MFGAGHHIYFCKRLEPICYFSSGPMSHMFLKIGECNFRDCPETVGVVIIGAREKLPSCLILERILYFETVHSYFTLCLLIYCNLRWKRLFCQSAEDPETQVTSTITKRRTSTSRRRKSAQKSLPIFSRRAGLPSGLTYFEETCTLLGEVEQRRHTFKTKKPHSFIPHS